MKIAFEEKRAAPSAVKAYPCQGRATAAGEALSAVVSLMVSDYTETMDLAAHGSACQPRHSRRAIGPDLRVILHRALACANQCPSNATSVWIFTPFSRSSRLPPISGRSM